MSMRAILAPIFAALTLIGCSRDSGNGRLSDAELLKLNQQCREAADKKANEDTTSFGNIYQTTSINSIKYSQTYRRCVGRFSQIQSVGENNAFSTSLTDPVSNDHFAIHISAADFLKREESCMVDPSMAGSRSGEPNFDASAQECFQLMFKVMAKP